MREGLKTVIQYAFAGLDLHRVMATIKPSADEAKQLHAAR